MKKITKFIIVSHRDNRGGPIVLAKLCRMLMDKGYDARLFYLHEFPVKDTHPFFFWIKWCYYILLLDKIKLIITKVFTGAKFLENASFANYSYESVKGCKKLYLPFYKKDSTIVVYPECYGNILNAKNVVRWLLYYYRYENVKGAYTMNDLFISYAYKYNVSSLNPDYKVIRLFHFDRDLFKQYNYGKRKERCYLIRKGHARKDLPKSYDGPVIDFNTHDSEVVRIFNEYKYCYLYDLNTFYAKIAVVCGCVPIYILEEGKTFKDYKEFKMGKLVGRAIGNTPEQIQYAIDTREELLKSLDFDETNNKFIDKFIKYIEEHFLNKKI